MIPIANDGSRLRRELSEYCCSFSNLTFRELKEDYQDVPIRILCLHSGNSKMRLEAEKYLTSERLGEATTRQIFVFSIGIEHPDL